jgi:hypothetical protein
MAIMPRLIQKRNMKKSLNAKTMILLLFDLSFLRYKTDFTWYELTDYVRDKLREDGVKIEYDDKNKDIIFNGQSLRKVFYDAQKIR